MTVTRSLIHAGCSRWPFRGSDRPSVQSARRRGPMPARRPGGRRRLREYFGPLLVILNLLVAVAVAEPADAEPAGPETPPSREPLTAAEASNYQETTRYADAIAFCQQLAKGHANVSYATFGRTVEGRALPLLVLADPPMPRPEAARRGNKLIILVVANIHAGEVCGKEAILALARDLPVDHPELLKQAVIVCAPVFNADGNERISRTNRPNQVGPQGGVGQRTNAQGLDLNRDHMKLEAPETRALVRLLDQWDPAIVIDCHTTNGSYHRYALTFDGPRHPAADPRLVRFTREVFLPQVSRRVREASGYQTFFYGNFDAEHRRWTPYPALGRYNTQYVALRQRIGILSEAYAYAPFQDRVLATREFVRQSLLEAVARREEVVKLTSEIRAAATSAARDDVTVPIDSAPAALPGKVAIAGFLERDEGGKRVATEEKREYQVDYLGGTVATHSVVAPHAYLLPPDLTAAHAKLQQHGLKLEVLREDLRDVELETYRVQRLAQAAGELQGHRLTQLGVGREARRGEVPAGTIVCRFSQPLGRLAVNLLEPEAADGLAAWNLLDEHLATGKLYPIQRLASNVPLLTSPLPVNERESSPVAAAERAEHGKSPGPRDQADARQAVDFATVFGRRVSFNGNPTRIRFVSESEFLQVKEGRVWLVDADTGRGRPDGFRDSDVARAIERTLKVKPEQATALARSVRSNLNPKRTAGWFVHQATLYAIAADGSDLRAMSAAPEQPSPEAKRDARADHAGDAPNAGPAAKPAPVASHPAADQPDASQAAAPELARFSPDGKWLAHVRAFDLVASRVSDGTTVHLTTGGNSQLRRGKADWVYFEEIYHRDWHGYRWSPDSQKIAVQEYDDSSVGTYLVLNHLQRPAGVEREHYPLAGQANPKARLGIADVAKGSVDWLPTQLPDYSLADKLITGFYWRPDSQALLCYIQDRTQRWLDVIQYDLATARYQKLFRETTKAWVSAPGEPRFLRDGSFLLALERDGWRHLYHFGNDGKLIRQLTSGPWEVREIKVVNEAEGWVGFTATRDSHLAENYYRVALAGGQPIERLTDNAGHHVIEVSPQGSRFVDSAESPQSPPQVTLYDRQGGRLRLLDSNPVPALARYRLGQVELLSIKTRDGFALPATLIKPPDFDPAKRYPVWLLTYGGPHAPTVRESWMRGRGFEQLLASLGIIAFRVDPRSASGQGAENTWTAYRQLGVPELRDLEDAVDYLCALPYVDSRRIGMSGHSYGGFLTAYALTHSKRFAAGIAGAPVTDWRNYDTFYTERYMGTPQENPAGYQKSSVLAAAKNLHGRLLITHGARDDNVHPANTLQLVHELQRANKQFELMIYPNSRHGGFGAHYDRLMIDFIKRTMLTESPADVAGSPAED